MGDESIFKLVQEERERFERVQRENNPFGPLDYKQLGDDPNMMWAFVVGIDPPTLNQLIGDNRRVLALMDVHVTLPHEKFPMAVSYLDIDMNLVFCKQFRGMKRGLIATQRWEKIYINSSPEFRAHNDTIQGVNMEPDFISFRVDFNNGLPSLGCPFGGYEGAVVASDITLTLVAAMLNHHVKGDAILKGLMSSLAAIGIDRDLSDFKMIENYLGGWIIRKNDYVVKSTEFVWSIDQLIKTRG